MNFLPVFDADFHSMEIDKAKGLSLFVELTKFTAVVDRNHFVDGRDLSYLIKINDKN